MIRTATRVSPDDLFFRFFLTLISSRLACFFFFFFVFSYFTTLSQPEPFQRNRKREGRDGFIYIIFFKKTGGGYLLSRRFNIVDLPKTQKRAGTGLLTQPPYDYDSLLSSSLFFWSFFSSTASFCYTKATTGRGGHHGFTGRAGKALRQMKGVYWTADPFGGTANGQWDMWAFRHFTEIRGGKMVLC